MRCQLCHNYQTSLASKRLALYRRVQIDEVRVACKGGAGLVGGIAESGGSQRQDLPIALTGFFQKIDEFIGLFAHGAHAVLAGQAGDVHQNTAASH